MSEAKMSERKRQALERCHRYWMPGRVDAFRHWGIPIVVGRREGYRMWDIDGHELIDVHLNGGTFNLGHRHPDVVRSLVEATAEVDIGNHHFPSADRGALAEKLAQLTPGDLCYSVFGATGSEVVDVAIRTARQATGRRKILAIDMGYHGRVGLAGQAGDDSTAKYFLSDAPHEFVKVPFGNAGAADAALAGGDIAAAIVETLPATYGFPIPPSGYLSGLQAACERHGALYIADEVQTGLGRTGRMWGVETFGVTPDILVTAKGLGGGLYPISAAVLSKRVAGWLFENAWGHVSTSGGAEIGCRVASTVLDLCSAPSTLENARRMSEYLGAGLAAIQSRNSYLVEVRRVGLVIGLKVDHPQGALHLTKALYDKGVWAMFAGYDMSVLQFKPGLLVDARLCDELLEKLEAALDAAKNP
ncbi:MAG TPA: aminotransferase class III-fold pyridoxal phosphate-dependent enzyme [Candidatus Kryptonia bacterium]|nr:aminotransferase class III-fold pyridoxal phosphate-dependent enzyme [Candidatus Kryptonia bacterium]